MFFAYEPPRKFGNIALGWPELLTQQHSFRAAQPRAAARTVSLKKWSSKGASWRQALPPGHFQPAPLVTRYPRSTSTAISSQSALTADPRHLCLAMRYPAAPRRRTARRALRIVLYYNRRKLNAHDPATYFAMLSIICEMRFWAQGAGRHHCICLWCSPLCPEQALREFYFLRG